VSVLVRIDVDRWGLESVVRVSDGERLMCGLSRFSGKRWAIAHGFQIAE
jgi:hypothetical protein